MRNSGLGEAQAGIKISGRNISNLRYADDTTLMADSEEELKGLLKNFPQFVMIYTVKGVNVVNEAKVDVSLKFSLFFFFL